MHFGLWAFIVGALLVTMALAGSYLRRLPVSTGMLYLAVGAGLGPVGLALAAPSPLSHAVLLERAAEVAVLISLFSIGLKLGVPLSDERWRIALRLASVSMIATVAMVAAIAYFGLGMPVGAAVLLGAILAPTDPVLASDVQVVAADDRDRLRFSLSAEGGLNDGTAFPFVMLGLGLLGLHDLGAGGWRWFAVDVVWAVGAGLAIGAACGAALGRLVVYLRTQHRLSVGLDEFLGLGLIAVTYGLAILSLAYGFLAVLAAGVALQRVQHADEPGEAPARSPLESTRDATELSTDSRYAGTVMAREVQSFNEQLERIAELAVVLVVGSMLHLVARDVAAYWLVAATLVLVRPLAVGIGLLGAPVVPEQWRLIAWFGIRGIGSIYYLMFAINHGLPPELATRLVGLTLAMVAASIVLHGVSVTPLMNRYARAKPRRDA